MRSLTTKTKNISRTFWILLMTVAVSGVGILLAHPVYADWVQDVFGPIILYGIFSPFIILLNLLTYALVKVALYNGFANATIVNIGWPIIRDVSNMFFVLILLVIAIGTIVKWDRINYRQNLRRLIIMALLINFSKTIVVFFIDISQIFTLTFINAVSSVLQVGMITALGLNKIANPVTEGLIDTSTQAGIGLFTYIMAGIMVAIAALTVAVMVIIFVVRIITLWVLMVFAPLAFLASTLPQTKRWYDEWWDALGKALVVAPVLAFMLWLVFAVVSKDASFANVGGFTGTDPAPQGVAPGDIIAFATAIGLLIYSIKLAIQMGGAGGKFASALQSKAAGGAKWLAYGSSGKGGLVGLVKSGATAAVTRPVQTAGNIAGGAYRLTVGGLGAGGVQTVGRIIGSERIQRAGARVREDVAARGRRFDAATKESRATFDSSRNVFARTARFGLGVLSRQEEDRQKARAAIYTGSTAREDLKSRVDNIQNPVIFPAKKAEEARQIVKDGQLEEIEKMSKAGQLPEGFAQQVFDRFISDSGLTAQEQLEYKKKNLRYVKDRQERKKLNNELADDKKLPSLDDLRSKNAAGENEVAANFVADAYGRLSKDDFGDLMKKMPRDLQDAIAKGMQISMRRLSDTATGRDPKEIDKDLERIRGELIKRDPDNIRSTYSKPIEKGPDGQYRFNTLAASDEAIIRQHVRKLKPKEFSSMKEDTLRDVGYHLAPGDIVKVINHEDMNPEQKEAIIESVGSHLGDENINVTFNSILKNDLVGGDTRKLVQESLNPASPDSIFSKLKTAGGDPDAAVAATDTDDVAKLKQRLAAYRKMKVAIDAYDTSKGGGSKPKDSATPPPPDSRTR